MCNGDWDADEVFAYNTVKIVRVKDRYLGFLRYSSMLAIFVYIFVFVLVLGKKYLAVEVPVGSVNTSLRKPVTGDAGLTFVDRYPYCTQYNATAYGPPNPYYISNDTLPCEVWDENDVFFPPDEPSAMFISSRVSILTQTKQCFFDTPSEASVGCRYPWSQGDERAIYMAGVEDYTIRVQHSFQATRFFRQTGDSMYALEAGSMMGKMIATNGSVVKVFGAGMDIVTVDEFLQAAGSSFAANSTNAGADFGESNRHGGLLIYVVISYSNLDSNGNDKPTYTFLPTAIPGSQYKVVQTVHLNDTTRQVFNRHGVKLQFLISGQIGRFDFQVMLVQLVSALGLLSVATLVVELTMLYVLPHRHYYQKYKYEETVDFSDVRDAEASGVDPNSLDLNARLAQQREQLYLPSVEVDDDGNEVASYGYGSTS